MESVTFICGCGHSGTSLIANMFAAHPEVYIPLEETAIFLGDEPKARRGFRRLRQRAEGSGRRYLVEKTPRHVRRLDFIRSIVPEAQFILPVRDGRDVVASFVRRDVEAHRAARRWMRDNRFVLESRESDGVVAYRHEDLVNDPEQTLRTICQGVGIPFCDEMLRYHEQPREWFARPEDGDDEPPQRRAEHLALRNWQINQPIFDSSGKWKSELSEDDLRPLLGGRGRRMMEAFGYLP